MKFCKIILVIVLMLGLGLTISSIPKNPAIADVSPTIGDPRSG